MATILPKAEIGIGEFEIIIEESKQKFIQSLIKEKEKVIEVANKDAKAILAKAYQDSELLIKKSQEDAKQTISQAKERADREADNLLSQARQKADQIIKNVEEQASSTLQVTKDEAEKRAKEITRAAEEIKRKAVLEIEQSQKKAAESTQKLVSDAKDAARKEAEKEASEILMKARQQAEDILNEAKDKVMTNFEDSNRLMMEIQQKMLQMVEATGLDVEKPECSVEKPQKSTSSPELQHAQKPIPGLKQENNTDDQNQINSIFIDEEQSYQGRLKIDIVPPVDKAQLSVLEQNLQKAPNLRVVAKNRSEDGGAWIEVELSKVSPLLDILRKLPDVRDVVGAKTYVIISMKSKQPVQ